MPVSFTLPDLLLNGHYPAHAVALYAILAARGGRAESMQQLHQWSGMSYRIVKLHVERLIRDGLLRCEIVKVWHGHDRHSIHIIPQEP